MAQIKVMKLWNAFVTAVLALCTALGLITVTATAAAATPRSEATNAGVIAQATTPTVSPWTFTRSLPPTMKQRIRAEAHGKSPSCRHRPPTDMDEATEALETVAQAQQSDHAEPGSPLQR